MKTQGKFGICLSAFIFLLPLTMKAQVVPDQVNLRSRDGHNITLAYQKNTISTPGSSATSTIASGIRISVDLGSNCVVDPAVPVVAQLYGVTSDGATVIQFVTLQVLQNCLFTGVPVYSLYAQTTDAGQATNFSQNLEIDVGNTPLLDPINGTSHFNFSL